MNRNFWFWLGYWGRAIRTEWVWLRGIRLYVRHVLPFDIKIAFRLVGLG